MSDTHINAYYGAVDEALKELLIAQSKYEEAKVALETKKLEDGVTESAPAADVPVTDEADKKKAFGRR